MTDLAEPLPGVAPAAVRHPARGYLLYLVAALLFALNGTVAKTLLLGGIEPSVLSQVRATAAFVILLVFVALTRPASLRIRRDEILIFFCNWVVQFTIDNGFNRRMLFPFAALIDAVGAFGPLQQTFAARVPERFKCQIGVDRVGAIADQKAMVVHLTSFARFDDDTDSRAFRFAHQMVVHGASRQE